MRISDWRSDVCSSDPCANHAAANAVGLLRLSAMKFALEFGEPLCRTRRQLLRSDLQQYGPVSLTRLIEAITRITPGSVGRLGLVGITLRTREGALEIGSASGRERVCQ